MTKALEKAGWHLIAERVKTPRVAMDYGKFAMPEDAVEMKIRVLKLKGGYSTYVKAVHEKVK